MPEPFTIILGGLALWSWFKAKKVSLATHPATATATAQPISTAGAGTGPDAPFATNTSVAKGSLALALTAQPIPAGLVVALDNDTALKLRDYAALNPHDFQMFLDRYAQNIVLRDDLFLHALTDPPKGGYQMTPGMIAGLGPAAYKVAQGLNGVAAGNYGDIFGVSATVAGQIPAVDPMLVKSLQAITLGYRAITSVNAVLDLASASGVTATTLFTAPTEALQTMQAAGVAGAYPGLIPGGGAPVPMAGVLMAVGLCIDIGFTIAGNEPDVQKAIDVALDVASLAVLFIPVIGVVIAIVIQLVKFVIDLFGGTLFGGGLSHAQREALETARYGANLNPMFPEIADSYTPRELFNTIVAWGSGYCGGRHVVAMAVTFLIPAGDVIQVGGKAYQVPAGGLAFSPGHNPAPGTCYWLANAGIGAITDDEQAILIAVYGGTIVAEAQAGIAEALKVQFDVPTQNLIAARTEPMRNFLAHGLSLDQIDDIAAEYRAQPHLNALAAAFGYADWQHMLSDVLADEWLRFNYANGHGTLADFARQNGYPTMHAFRAAAFASYESYFAGWQTALTALQASVQTAQGSLLAAASTQLPSTP